MSTIPSVQLFRNSEIISGRDAAITALETQKAFVADGGLILARYSSDGTETNVKTLLGIVRNGGGTNSQLTIIDVEGAAKNVQSAIEKAINDLNKADNAVDGQYVSSVSEDKGIITVTRKPLPSVEKSGTSQHITVGVTQNHGEITLVTVQEDNIASASLLGTTSDTKDNETAFGYIAKEAADRAAAIGALNLTQVGGDGKVITAITQTNGVVNATADTLSASSVAFSSLNFTTSTNVNDALETLYTRSGDGSKVTLLESTEGTEDGVLKVYTIKQGGSEVGKINIPKDLVVTSGSVVKGTWNGGTFTEEESGSGTALKLVIANQTNPVYINTLDLVKDHTAGNGIAISDTNEISVQIAEGSENFLTVDEKGVKLSGVQAAIDTTTNNKISTLKASIKGESDHVDVTVGQADGIITSVTVANEDIASAAALAAETSSRVAQDDKIEAAVGLNADGSHITTTGNYTSDATTVVGEIAALDTKLKEVSDTLGTGVSTVATVTAQLQALSGKTGDGSTATSVEGAKAYAKDLVDNLDADVESTTESTTETTTTKAIRIKQTNGKIASITLGAFDCGVY